MIIKENLEHTGVGSGVHLIGPPYGDDPHDQYWIDQGYQFK